MRTAAELVAAYRSGELSPVEVTEAVLERIERRDGELNAFCLVDAERALADARASEERWRAAAPTGALDGVPVAVKDVFLTRGWPTRRGSRAIDPAGPWDEDSPAVASLRRHGAVLPGKTTTPELGWKGVTDSPLEGVTRNPWDPTRTSGGSSGGSAAALSAGMVPLALGTDGGGSIRIPCGFCGLAGIKPTYGRVPAWPASPYGPVAHCGPMARTVTDAALLLDAIAEPDSRDWAALPPPEGSFLDGLERGVNGLRVAFSPDLGHVRVDPAVAAPVARAAAAFADLGADVEQVDPGFEDPRAVFDVLWSAGAARGVADLGDPPAHVLDPGLAEIAAAGRSRTVLEYLAALQARDTDERLPRALGAVAHPDAAAARLRCRARGPGGLRRSSLAELDPAHVSVQPHAAAGGERTVRVHARRPARRPADRGGPPRGRAGPARSARLRVGAPATDPDPSLRGVSRWPDTSR